MDIATIGAKDLKERGLLPETGRERGDQRLLHPCAAQVDGKDQDWLLMFKNETHNHPTEIEPFGGAATCIGGASATPCPAGTTSTRPCASPAAATPAPRWSETLEGKLPQRKIAQTAAAGYSSYGNQIGLATGTWRSSTTGLCG